MLPDLLHASEKTEDYYPLDHSLPKVSATAGKQETDVAKRADLPQYDNKG